MPDDVSAAIGPGRRAFVKRLVVGTAFAVPAVATFKMSGIAAIFGDTPGAVTGGANGNTGSQPKGPAHYGTVINCAIVSGGGAMFSVGDGAATIQLVVPAGALLPGTNICVFRGDPSSIDAELPAGQSTVSAYGVAWNTPPLNTHPDALADIVLNVSDASIVAGLPLYMFDKSSGALVAVGATTAGAYSVSFRQDPGFVATTAPAAAPAAPAPGETAVPAAPIIAPAQTTG